MLVSTLFVLSVGCALAYEFVEYDMDEAEMLFEQFINDYNKVYEDEQEKQMRFNIFKERLDEINQRNKQHGYNVMGINRFADLSKEEFKSKYLGLIFNEEEGTPCYPGFLGRAFRENVPESFDWRDKDVLPKVKSQGGCGACWAFSSISNVESQYAKKHGKVISLSEQQLVDCDQRNGGCNGGAMSRAITTLMETGVMAEADYPYRMIQEQCMYDENKVKVNVTGCLDFSHTPEEDIKAIVFNNGPLTIALAAEPFQSYKKGVFKHCEEDAEINHALLLVGYGTDETTKQPYWVIRNSWGEEFGENGYIRMVRGNSACRIGEMELISAQVE